MAELVVRIQMQSNLFSIISTLDVDVQMDLFCIMCTKNVLMPMNVLITLKMIVAETEMLVEVPNVKIHLDLSLAPVQVVIHIMEI